MYILIYQCKAISRLTVLIHAIGQVRMFGPWVSYFRSNHLLLSMEKRRKHASGYHRIDSNSWH